MKRLSCYEQAQESIEAAEKAIEEAKQCLNKAITDEYTKETKEAARRILGHLTNDISYLEGYGNYEMARMEINEEPYSLTLECMFIPKK